MSTPDDLNQLAASLGNVSLSNENQIFHEQRNHAKGLLGQTDTVGRVEMARLRNIIHRLTSENAKLKSAQQVGASMPRVVTIFLAQAPMKSLDFPYAAFYNELLPKLAKFMENNKELFNEASEFEEIWRGIGRAQSALRVMFDCGYQIRELAIENYKLRALWVQRATGEERKRLETVHGEPPNADAFANASRVLPTMTSLFERDSSKMRGLLEDAKRFKRSESRRLSRIIQGLRSENATLQGNLNNQETITAEVSNVLREVPVRCLPMPSPAYFDELMPLLAEFFETYDDDYRENSTYDSIWEDFARMQAAENGLDRCAKLTKDLAIENHGIRMKIIELAAGELKETLKAINGEAPHPTVFVYHPYSAYYIPSFPGQGIPHSGGKLEVADSVAFFDLDEYFCIATPADAVLWVKKTGNNGSWVF
ncbi:uncharacterized protein J3D65DRAFT_666099 [Phyllosticta citribraziliensis]|uniref:Uncharacterized protein n=1 Tax=Phyllosticta citribraziliensis TaxID=989973 RepID=A0ABR1LW02_9PEZI